jgi:hypothetical protein
MNVHLPPGRRWPGRLANFAIIVLVIALAGATFALSYSGVHQIALSAGVPKELARLYPGIFDAVLVVACAAALMLRDASVWTRIYAWISILILVGIIGAADAIHAMGVVLPHRPAEGTVAALPWALVMLGFSLWLTMLRHARSQSSRQAVAARQPVAAGQAVPGMQAVPGVPSVAGMPPVAGVPTVAGAPPVAGVQPAPGRQPVIGGYGPSLTALPPGPPTGYGANGAAEIPDAEPGAGPGADAHEDFAGESFSDARDLGDGFADEDFSGGGDLGNADFASEDFGSEDFGSEDFGSEAGERDAEPDDEDTEPETEPADHEAAGRREPAEHEPTEPPTQPSPGFRLQRVRSTPVPPQED